MANDEDLLGNVIGSFAKLFANIWQFFLSNDFAHLEASNGVNGDLINIYILYFLSQNLKIWANPMVPIYPMSAKFRRQWHCWDLNPVDFRINQSFEDFNQQKLRESNILKSYEVCIFLHFSVSPCTVTGTPRRNGMPPAWWNHGGPHNWAQSQKTTGLNHQQ